MDKVDILGVRVCRIGVKDAAEEIIRMIGEGGYHAVFTPNSEIIMQSYESPKFRQLINSADMLTADGIGVVYAAKIFGKPVPERAAGYDISRALMERMAQGGNTLFLLGAAPGVAQKAKEKLTQEYKGLSIVGVQDGYFDSLKEAEIIAEINRLRPDVLFVCLGSPKQEHWICDNRDRLHVKVAMGLGGCLDVYAGTAKRAPEIYIRLGLEWLYRLMKEPKRFFRMLALPKFLFTVIIKRIFGGKHA